MVVTIFCKRASEENLQFSQIEDLVAYVTKINDLRTNSTRPLYVKSIAIFSIGNIFRATCKIHIRKGDNLVWINLIYRKFTHI